MKPNTNANKRKESDKLEKQWAKVPTAARHMDLSPRAVRNLIKSGEIRHSRLESGTILIKIEWLDEFLLRREVKENRMDRIISDVLTNFKINNQ